MATTAQVLIFHDDMFATQGEHIFFYPDELLPQACADALLTVNHAPEPALSVITYADLQAHNLALPQAVTFTPFRRLIANLTQAEANQLAKAMQLVRWRDEHRFCSRCGAPTVRHPHEYASVCEQCHHHQYPRIQPCIITAIVKVENNRPYVLLAQHQRAKATKMYTVIAGFVEVGESLEQCVHREVMEEVGLTVTNLRYVASQPWPFPSNLMVGFIATYVSGKIVIDEHELITADFFALDELDKVNTPPKGTIAHDLITYVKQDYLTNA